MSDRKFKKSTARNAAGTKAIKAALRRLERDRSILINALSPRRPGAPAPARAAARAAKQPALDTESAVTTTVIVRARQTRFNPLRTLTAESLMRAMESFRYGDLKWAAYLWEAMADQDDTISSVKPKREKSTAHRESKVLVKNDDDSENKVALEHQAVLKDFWANVKAVNAYDRNEKGGLQRLIRQMASAISYKYAVHHIMWDPKPGLLRATFEFVPLYFFENRTGILRFIPDGISTTGIDMEPVDWMVTVSDGLMMSAGILAFFKRLAHQDLNAFSEKFGMPGVVGKTKAGKDTEAGRAMADAVDEFGNDWSAVLYGDDGEGSIELVEAKASASSIPMPLILERCDRKIATLYRGADLSTMSSGKGEGTGASVQLDETRILDRDDACIITETLAEVERTVIAWHFGEGVEPLAGLKIIVPDDQDLKLVLAIIMGLASMGVPFDVADVLARFGFALPKEGSELLTPPPTAEKMPATNEKPRLAREKRLRDAIKKDMEPAAIILEEISKARTPDEMKTVMAMAKKRFPALTTSVLANDFTTQFLAEFVGEEFLDELEEDKEP